MWRMKPNVPEPIAVPERPCLRPHSEAPLPPGARALAASAEVATVGRTNGVS